MSSETSFEEFDPNSRSEVTVLLPTRCLPCKYAQFLIAAEMFGNCTGNGPITLIKDIDEKCPGYQGESDFDPNFIQETATGLMIPTRSEAELENCPYSLIESS